MATPWYDFGVSQGYGQNGEQGVDVATPFHTPISNLYSGTVVEAQYGSAGGIVGIATNVPGLGQVVEYFLHLDLINVAKGQIVKVGQIVGLSGGETPAQAPTLGGLHPAQPQFSTGPHTEFGFFQGLPFMSQNAGNPLGFLHPDTSSNTPTASGTTGTGNSNGSSSSVPAYCNIPVLGGLLCPQQAQVATAVNIAQNGQKVQQFIDNPIGYTFSTLLGPLATSLENVGFFILALMLIFIGIVLIAYEPLQQGAREAVKGAFIA